MERESRNILLLALVAVVILIASHYNLLTQIGRAHV